MSNRDQRLDTMIGRQFLYKRLLPVILRIELRCESDSKDPSVLYHGSHGSKVNRAQCRKKKPEKRKSRRRTRTEDLVALIYRHTTVQS